MVHRKELSVSTKSSKEVVHFSKHD